MCKYTQLFVILETALFFNEKFQKVYRPLLRMNDAVEVL